MKGTSHDFTAALLMPVAASIAFYHHPIPMDVAIAATGYFIGFVWLSPDIDHHVDTRPIQRWGIFKFLLAPYRNVFKHRGLSHIPIVGTLTRSPYPLIFLIPIMVYLGYSNEFIQYFLTLIFIGIAIADCVHIVCDYCPGLNRL